MSYTESHQRKNSADISSRAWRSNCHRAQHKVTGKAGRQTNLHKTTKWMACSEDAKTNTVGGCSHSLTTSMFPSPPSLPQDPREPFPPLGIRRCADRTSPKVGCTVFHLISAVLSSRLCRDGTGCPSARPRPWTQAAHHDRKLACPGSTCSSNCLDVGSDGLFRRRGSRTSSTSIDSASLKPPLSHFVTHVNIARSSCKHVWRLRPRPRYLRSGIRRAQLTNCTQFFPFQRSYAWFLAYSAWYSALSRDSPPTDIRRRPVVRLARP